MLVGLVVRRTAPGDRGEHLRQAGVVGRPTRSTEIVYEGLEPGMSAAMVAFVKHGISIRQIYTWRQQLLLRARSKRQSRARAEMWRKSID